MGGGLGLHSEGGCFGRFPRSSAFTFTTFVNFRFQPGTRLLLAALLPGIVVAKSKSKKEEYIIHSKLIRESPSDSEKASPCA